jgi:hypothetical protein
MLGFRARPVAFHRIPAPVDVRRRPPRASSPWPLTADGSRQPDRIFAGARVFPAATTPAVNNRRVALTGRTAMDEATVCAALNVALTGDGQFLQGVGSHWPVPSRSNGAGPGVSW